MADNIQNESDVAAINQLRDTYADIKSEMAKVIHGQNDVIEKMMICILSRGHSLLMGVPGLAKTLMVHSLSEMMTLKFSRIQFTPDLMPSDITGTDILQETDQPGRRAFEFAKGPVFANIVLADEINRTPPKTQAALLQAMQEHEVSVVGRTFKLEEPFFVLATQNPIEQEGTYPLPEAQLDRFMFFIKVKYPSKDEELAIAKTTTGVMKPKLGKIIDGGKILFFQDLVRRVPVPEHIYEYVVNLVRKTRPDSPDSPDWLKPLVTWGAGPRAVQYLILGAKARAVLQGSYLVRQEDIESVVNEVLTHRILLSFHAETEGVTTEDIIKRLTSESQINK
ncbi:MAG TPA: AAA family ATPase [Lentisphaeria bacterium]|nr:MAG: AAA family ATPase [Lentisphaerae bacterium GWF2_50_93]HCE46385.1 AAA family ATPase [Lentisphaeria bacterium]